MMFQNSNKAQLSNFLDGIFRPWLFNEMVFAGDALSSPTTANCGCSGTVQAQVYRDAQRGDI